MKKILVISKYTHHAMVGVPLCFSMGLILALLRRSVSFDILYPPDLY